MTPRIREFTSLSVRDVKGIIHNFKNAHVTFWSDGWVEVFGTVLNEHGTSLGKMTNNYSNFQTVALAGKEKDDGDRTPAPASTL